MKDPNEEFYAGALVALSHLALVYYAKKHGQMRLAGFTKLERGEFGDRAKGKIDNG